MPVGRRLSVRAARRAAKRSGNGDRPRHARSEPWGEVEHPEELSEVLGVAVELGATDDEPDLDAAMSVATFFALASGDLAPLEALHDRVQLDAGDPEAFGQFFRMFSFAPRLAPRAVRAVAVA